jgi:hypothetical protein
MTDTVPINHRMSKIGLPTKPSFLAVFAVLAVVKPGFSK